MNEDPDSYAHPGVEAVVQVRVCDVDGLPLQRHGPGDAPPERDADLGALLHKGTPTAFPAAFGAGWMRVENMQQVATPKRLRFQNCGRWTLP